MDPGLGGSSHSPTIAIAASGARGITTAWGRPLRRMSRTAGGNGEQSGQSAHPQGQVEPAGERGGGCVATVDERVELLTPSGQGLVLQLGT